MSIISPRVREKLEENTCKLTRMCDLEEPNTRLKDGVGVLSATWHGEKLGVGLVLERFVGEESAESAGEK